MTFDSSHESILHPKLWTADAIVSDPDAIISLHNSYYEAGADIGTTSSYQVEICSFYIAVNEVNYN